MPLAKKAIELNAGEGHWHLVLAKLMRSGRTTYEQEHMHWPHSVEAERDAAHRAFQLRKNVETYLVLAGTYQDMGYHSKALDLMK